MGIIYKHAMYKYALSWSSERLYYGSDRYGFTSSACPENSLKDRHSSLPWCGKERKREYLEGLK